MNGTYLFVATCILMLMSSDQPLRQLLECLDLTFELMQFCMKTLLLPQLHFQHIGSMPHRHHARKLGFHPLEPCFQLDPLLFKTLLLLLHFERCGDSGPAFLLHVGVTHLLPHKSMFTSAYGVDDRAYSQVRRLIPLSFQSSFVVRLRSFGMRI